MHYIFAIYLLDGSINSFIDPVLEQFDLSEFYFKQSTFFHRDIKHDGNVNILVWIEKIYL